MDGWICGQDKNEWVDCSAPIEPLHVGWPLSLYGDGVGI